MGRGQPAFARTVAGSSSGTRIRSVGAGGAEKVAQVCHGTAREVTAEGVEHLLPWQSTAIDDAIRRLQVGDVVGRMPAPSQPDVVEADDAAALTVEQHERRDVLDDARVPADHGESADPDELVHGDGTRHERPVLDRDVTAEQGAVGEDAVVAHRDIVPQMGSRHHVVVAADRRGHVRLERPVHRDVFAEDVVVADHHAADVLRPGDVLWGAADHDVLRELVVGPGGDAGLEHGPASDRAVIPEFDVVLDGGERRDPHARAETGSRTDHGEWMDAHVTPLSPRIDEPLGLSARSPRRFNPSFVFVRRADPSSPAGRRRSAYTAESSRSVASAPRGWAVARGVGTARE